MQPSQLPLTALRAFEAAARHLSFKAAAAELHVTPTAVSHQIQALERILGLELFVRVHRRLVLTPAARACLEPLREGFGALCCAMETLRQHQDTGRVLVSAPPSFTMRLLMPITHLFLSQHPEIDLNVTTRMREPGHIGRHPSEEAETLHEWAEASDVVIVYGGGACPGLEVEELLPLSIRLLCSPDLLAGRPALRRPADVAKFPWLHDERGAKYGGASFWSLWLAAAGLKLADEGRGGRFTHAALAIDAAVRGKGLLVTTPALCRSELDAGLLVAPFDLEVPLDCSYYLVHRRTSQPAVLQFKRWLREALEDLVSRPAGSPP